MANTSITLERIYSIIQHVKRELDALVQMLAQDDYLSDEATEALEAARATPEEEYVLLK